MHVWGEGKQRVFVVILSMVSGINSSFPPQPLKCDTFFASERRMYSTYWASHFLPNSSSTTQRHVKRHGASTEDGIEHDHEDPDWRDARIRDLMRLHAQSTIAGDLVEFSTERQTLNAVCTCQAPPKPCVCPRPHLTTHAPEGDSPTCRSPFRRARGALR